MSKLSFSRFLESKFGGRWKYNRRTSSWQCNDGRHVARCAQSLDEFDNSVGTVYYLYGEEFTKNLYLERFEYEALYGIR